MADRITVRQAVVLANQILGHWGRVDIPRMQQLLRTEAIAGRQRRTATGELPVAVKQWATAVHRKRAQRTRS